jgi:hypothetical protein
VKSKKTKITPEMIFVAWVDLIAKEMRKKYKLSKKEALTMAFHRIAHECTKGGEERKRVLRSGLL